RINEIMYAPAAGVPEWVELFNASTDSVELTRWILGNRSQSSRYEIGVTSLLVAPEHHAVITKDTALFREAYPLIGGSIVQLASLPTFLWNNAGDAVVVVDNRGVVMDSVMYSSSWGGTEGRSLERIDPLETSNDSTNWATSNDPSGATPARANSHGVLNFDLRLLRISADTARPGGSVRVHVVVQNVGRMTVSGFDLVLFDDVNGDSVGTPDEMFYQQAFALVLVRRDSLTVPVEWSNPSSGIHTVLAQVVYPPDERLSNNRATVTVSVGYAQKVLVVNEIMYAPFSEGAEYVELTNVGTEPVDLTGWSIRDRAGSSGANVIQLGHRGRRVSSGEYFVVSSDSSILRSFPSVDTGLVTIVNQSSLSLNNDGDDVVLLDPTGLVIDSVAYTPLWHNPNVRDVSGRSLERINPLLLSGDGRNWSTCTYPLGGTPGRQNSIFAATLPSSSQLTISPNPFSPDGDGREDFAVLQYELPLTVSMIRIRIYDAAGRRIRTLANNEPSGSRGSIVWDGLDDERRKARVGIHVILLEAIDDRGGVVETVKAAVVVAAKL
ncbi:MAG TPA: lamin tail domain-containing protein, partial [Bacteroidota bacterium]|nr:lamin tail domain-containing protein [Bacteroidota bacterium]